jgi:hypothetical protein
MVKKVVMERRVNIHGIRKRKVHIIKMKNLVKKRKKVVTKNHHMMKLILIVNIMKVVKRRRKENMDIKNITKKDLKLPDIIRKLTKTNIIKNINSMMTNMKMENIRNMETNMNIIMKKKENTR